MNHIVWQPVSYGLVDKRLPGFYSTSLVIWGGGGVETYKHKHRGAKTAFQCQIWTERACFIKICCQGKPPVNGCSQIKRTTNKHT